MEIDEKVLYYNGTPEEYSEIKLALSRAGIQTPILPADPSARFHSSNAQSPKLESLGRLAGGVAHDFNNILSTIHLCAEYLYNRLSEPLLKENADVILKATEKGTALTKHLLAFTRNQIPEPQEVDINFQIEDLIKILQRLVSRNITLTTDFDHRPCKVKIDPVSLEQVIINLVINARDAMPEGGNIHIQTSNTEVLTSTDRLNTLKAGSYIAIVVNDTGSGIDEALQEKIFEPFFSTKGTNGTGLGLSTVFGIVKQNNGSVKVKSSIGTGSTFEVLLPALID
ncbi:MAG: domain S-box-containing protein [Pseudobdellovibrio sp.]|jgi:signal transduction histidine kinase|nr:domain S-box-containing protein [Pseudobdellovibrio sp.]